MTCRESYTIEKHALLVFISAFLSPYDELFNIKQNFKMKKYMPLEGLRWSRDSGSALYDTPQTAVLGRAGGQNGKVAVDLILNVVLILILLIIAKIELIPEPYKTLFSTDKVAKFYMFFQMGKFVNTYSMFGSLFKKQWVYTFCMVAYFFLFTKFGYDLQGVNAMSFILPVCGIIVLTNMVEKNQMQLNSHGILASIGKNSLEIYLVHFLVLSLIPKEIVDSCGSVYLQLFVLLLLSVVCIMVSLAMAKFIHGSNILVMIKK